MVCLSGDRDHFRKRARFSSTRPAIFSAATFALAQAWLSTLGLWSCCFTDGVICALDTARCWKRTVSPRDERWILRIRWIKSTLRKTTRICFYRIQWRNTCRCFTPSTTELDFPSRTATLSAVSKRTGVGVQSFTHVNSAEFCRSRVGMHVRLVVWTSIKLNLSPLPSSAGIILHVHRAV